MMDGDKAKEMIVYTFQQTTVKLNCPTATRDRHDLRCKDLILIAVTIEIAPRTLADDSTQCMLTETRGQRPRVLPEVSTPTTSV